MALVVTTFSNPWPFNSDDSLFYIVIARNIVQGHGITFSRIMPTNGVQPLWQGVVTAVVGTLQVFGIRGATATLRSLFVVNWAFAGLALFQMSRLLRDVDIRPPVREFSVVVLGLMLCGPWTMFGSEGHMTAMLVVLVLRRLVRVIESRGADSDESVRAPSWNDTLVLGGLGGLLSLSRLDSVWFVLAVFVAALFPLNGRPSATRTVRVAAGGGVTVAVLAPYLAWNLLEFGHLMPISGALKVDTGHPRFDLTAAGNMALGVLSLVVVAGGAAAATRSTPLLLRRVWFTTTVGACVGTGWYIAFSKGGYTQFNWYLMVHAVALALTAAMVAAAIASRDTPPRAVGTAFRRLLPVVSVGLGVMAAVYSSVRISHGSADRAWVDLRRFSGEVAARVPPGDRLATVDFPGILGLTAREQDVLALDGLTGDFDFQSELRDRGIECTLRRNGVRWLVTERVVPATPDPGGKTASLWYASWLYREPESRIAIDLDADQGLTPGRRDYHLWRINPSC